MDIYATLIQFLKLIEIVIVIVLSLASIKISSYIINNLKIFKDKLTIIYAIKDLIKYIIVFVAIIVIFNIVGIDLEGIFISIGVVGIVVSLAAKDIISNFISGFFLIIDKTLEVGDTMEIKDLKGEVKQIGLRNTIILTENNETVVIPNSTLSTTPYSKFKNHENEKVILDIDVPLNMDINNFKTDVLDMIDNMDEISKNPKPTIKSKGISKRTNLEVKFWTKTFNKKEEYKFIITNQIREIINKNTGDDN